jgi:hypothetical protein
MWSPLTVTRIYVVGIIFFLFLFLTIIKNTIILPMVLYSAKLGL